MTNDSYGSYRGAVRVPQVKSSPVQLNLESEGYSLLAKPNLKPEGAQAQA